jgi:hypothetical protein
MMLIDMSLNNKELYAGCSLEEVAGRLNLKTPAAEAVNVVGRNIGKIVQEMRKVPPAGSVTEVTLTGPMAVWAYLVVFHAVLHTFSKVYYDDGKSGPLLIAAHG